MVKNYIFIILGLLFTFFDERIGLDKSSKNKKTRLRTFPTALDKTQNEENLKATEASRVGSRVWRKTRNICHFYYVLQRTQAYLL